MSRSVGIAAVLLVIGAPSALRAEGTGAFRRFTHLRYASDYRGSNWFFVLTYTR